MMILTDEARRKRRKWIIDGSRHQNAINHSYRWRSARRWERKKHKSEADRRRLRRRAKALKRLELESR